MNGGALYSFLSGIRTETIRISQQEAEFKPNLIMLKSLFRDLKLLRSFVLVTDNI